MERKLKKVCFRCKKLIEDTENYYSFTEFNNKKVIHIDYTHRKCWDDFLKNVSNLEKAQNILNRIDLTPLINMGLIKPVEVRI